MTQLPSQACFHDERAAVDFMVKLTYPDGLTCERCGHTGEFYEMRAAGPGVFRCPACRTSMSVRAQTFMRFHQVPFVSYTRAIWWLLFTDECGTINDLSAKLNCSWKIASTIRKRIEASGLRRKPKANGHA